MKSTKILLAATALVLSLGAYSQTDTTKKDTTKQKMDTTKKKPELTESATTNLQDQQSVTGQKATVNTNTNQASSTNSTSNSNTNTNTTNTAAATTTSSTTTANSGTATATPKPNFGRYYIPVLGSYNAVASTTDNKSLKITPDESNPGKIWVEGLTDAKFYALLKAVPGTYKIPAQKQDDKSVAEGTLIYDENSKQISLCSGCGFNEQAPTASAEPVAATDASTEPVKNKKHHEVVAKVKKVTVISFTGTKADQGTVSLLQ